MHYMISGDLQGLWDNRSQAWRFCRGRWWPNHIGTDSHRPCHGYFQVYTTCDGCRTQSSTRWLPQSQHLNCCPSHQRASLASSFHQLATGARTITVIQSEGHAHRCSWAVHEEGFEGLLWYGKHKLLGFFNSSVLICVFQFLPCLQTTASCKSHSYFLLSSKLQNRIKLQVGTWPVTLSSSEGGDPGSLWQLPALSIHF